MLDFYNNNVNIALPLQHTYNSLYMGKFFKKNYDGIRALVYKVTKEDKKESSLSKSEKMKSKLLKMVGERKKLNIQERINFLSNLNTQNNE